MAYGLYLMLTGIVVLAAAVAIVVANVGFLWSGGFVFGILLILGGYLHRRAGRRALRSVPAGGQFPPPYTSSPGREMPCRACGMLNPHGSRFCGQCGRALRA